VNKAETLIAISKEGRAWAEILHLPVLSALLAWHIPQPSWVKRLSSLFRDKNNV